MKRIDVTLEDGKITNVEETNLRKLPYEENLEEKVDAFIAQFAVPHVWW